jgi:hypothetical protein
MTNRGRNVTRRLSSENELGLVPVTWTLCASKKEERVVSSSAVGICEVYAAPLWSFPVTEPVELIVAVETLFAVTSLTNPV